MLMCTNGSHAVACLPSPIIEALTLIGRAHARAPVRIHGAKLLWGALMRMKHTSQASTACVSCLLQAELNSVVSVLEEHALDTITMDHTQGSRGQELTTLTLVCKADDGDQVAAALLQVGLAAAVPRGGCVSQCELFQVRQLRSDRLFIQLHHSLTDSLPILQSACLGHARLLLAALGVCTVC
jgi:hypothetical protein